MLYTPPDQHGIFQQLKERLYLFCALKDYTVQITNTNHYYYYLYKVQDLVEEIHHDYLDDCCLFSSC